MSISSFRRNSSQMTNEERDGRVEDYLNDKLQTYADLENLDSLLETVKEQQGLLRQQLQDAEKALDVASKASKAQSANLQQQADRFNKLQGNIDRRLLIVTRSETSDDAVRKFDASMEKLRRLEIATGYVNLLAAVDELKEEGRQNFRASPQDALKPYLRLQNIAIALKKAQPAAEDAAPHLVDHFDKTAQDLWRQMKDAFASKFEETLKKLNWPTEDAYLTADLQTEWTTAIEKLLELQEPELKAHENMDDRTSSKDDSIVLLPLEVMVKPLELRFRYHFEGDRPTNRPDKPEYFLSHTVGLLNTYDEFFAVNLQPVLSRYFRGSNLALNSCYINSTSALITAMLPMLRQKISSLLSRIGKEPQLLSHLMHELMSFDASLREDWAYDGGCGTDGWRGLTWEVLVKKDWFGKWLKVEKEFALSRYHSIIDAPESGEIDYDSVDPGTSKPTKAAIRVNDLLETVTDRYRPLISFSQKLKFLIDIQIAIFDQFHDRLSSALEAYLTVTSALARAVQGVSKEEHAQLQGLGGLERLCRVYGSAEYLEKKMRDWSDDVFFLELWDELQFRARSRAGQTVTGNMTISDVAGRTSSSVGSDDDSGALFDETAGAYRRLRIRAETIIQDLLNHDVRQTLRPYGRINPWSSLASDSVTPSSLAITAELDGVIQQLTSYLSFLARALAEVALRRMCRQLMLYIQTFLWDYVLLRHNFSTSGATQFARDVYSFYEVFDRYLGPGQGELGMRKLREAVGLLGMPIKSEHGDGNGDSDGTSVQNTGLGIWEVEKRIFRNNESAREVLEELGFETLTEAEARSVLERRLELSG